MNNLQIEYSCINYLAIEQLEKLGIDDPNQEQINCMERIIELSLQPKKSKKTTLYLVSTAF